MPTSRHLPFVHQQADGAALVSLYVQPKAARNQIIGLHDGALKLAITAPPVDGQANAAVVAFLAEALGLTKKDITIRHGQSSRRKQVAVRGLAAEVILAKLAPSDQDGTFPDSGGRVAAR